MKDRTIDKIVENAQLLQERVADSHTAAEANTGKPPDQVDDDVLKILEKQTGLEPDCIGYYFGDNRWPEDEPIPKWASTLRSVVEYIDGESREETGSVDEKSDIPFGHVLQEIASHGYRRLHRNVSTELLCDSAVAQLEHYIVERLSEMAAKALHLDFAEFIIEREPEVIREQRRSSTSTEWYDRYVSSFLNGRVTDFFQEYPVLARQISNLLDQWVAMGTEFVSRLNSDYQDLADLVEESSLGLVTKLSLGEGDPHDHGRTVISLTFESGDQLVYKPRSLRTAERFGQMIGWLCESTSSFPKIQTPDILCRPNYGWMEKIERTDLDTLNAARQYYRRAGGFLCILYVLNAGDCHSENVIAGSQSPVLIDSEMLFNVPLSTVSGWRRNAQLQRFQSRSSLAGTLLLPLKVGNTAQTSPGIGVDSANQSRIKKVFWRHVNTDAIDYEYRKVESDPEDNVPTVQGDVARPEHFLDELLDGFEAAYRAILDQRESVVEQVKELFAGITIRKVVLASALYGALEDTLTNPEYLRDGAVYGIKVQKTLSRQLSTLHGAIQSYDWGDVLQAERTSIIRGDTPKFTMQTDSNGLYHDGERIASTDHGETPLDFVCNEIGKMSRSDLAYQLGQIRACFNEDIADDGHW